MHLLHFFREYHPKIPLFRLPVEMVIAEICVCLCVPAGFLYAKRNLFCYKVCAKGTLCVPVAFMCWRANCAGGRDFLCGQGIFWIS